MRPQFTHPLLAALIGVVFTFRLVAQPTALTYQGHLMDGGSPASGVYDIECVLTYLDGGHHVSAAFPVTNSAVVVSNGLFILTLDFGSDAFSGGDRFLFLGVRTNGGGAFTVLNPPQPIGSAPYAIRAAHAGTIDAGTVQDPAFIGTTTTAPLELTVNNEVGFRMEYPTVGNVPNLIGGSSVNNVGAGTRGAVVGGGDDNFIGFNSGFGVIGGGWENTIGDASDYSTISGGRRNTIGGNAYSSTIGGGFANSIGGNSDYAVIAGGNFNDIGINAAYSMIGGGFDNNIADDAWRGFIPCGDFNAIGVGADNAFAAGHRAKANHSGTFVWADMTEADFASTGSNQFLIRASGGVGIGTARPGARLEVAGNNFLESAIRHRSFNSGNTNVWDIGQRVISSSQHYLSVENNGSPELVIRNTGRVGIGTTSPEGDVHIMGNSATGSLVVTPNTANSQSQLLLCENTSASFGMIMRYAGGDTDNPLHFIGWNGDAEGSPLMTIERTGGGNVGIGVSNPAEKLEVAGNITATGTINGSSDRDRKENFVEVNPQEVLERVSAMPIQRWNYIGEDVPHIGPVAQDFHGAFQVGVDDKHISMVDADGVALAAIQGLNAKLERAARNSENEIETLKAQNAALRQELHAIKQVLEKLISEGSQL